MRRQNLTTYYAALEPAKGGLSAANGLRRTLLGVGVASVLAAGLSGCAGVRENIADGTFFDTNFWASSPAAKENSEAELGLAALAKGDQVTAEAHFQKALKANPQDIHALLGMGLLFQSRGMNVKAREMYEAIMAIRPDASQQMVVWQDQTTRPISEIASLNMALIDSGGVVSGLQRGAAGEMPAYGIAPALPAADRPAGPKQIAPDGTVSDPTFVQADANIVSRFMTLRALADQGLLTGEEYAVRRQANVGALLPLTSPPPAAGLDRPVPSADQISGRLRAIGRALEMRAMTVGQHAAERAMILDALMPAAPVAVANPGLPPQGLMEAADEVRKLEELKAKKLISDDEYARERQAIERALQPAGMAPAKPAAAATGGSMPKALSPGEAAPMQMAAASGPAVHLASYRSRTDAERGWAQLKRAHQALLGNLSANITSVNLPNGTFWRLKAGPLPSAAAASDLCSKLKARRQYCAVDKIEG